MGAKRKRENLNGKPRSKKQKKNSLPIKVDNASLLENKFETLQNHLDEESDSELIYDYDRKKSEELTDEVVLIDSDDEFNKSSVGSDNDNSESEEKHAIVDKEETPENELANNEDFIGFGFSSEDESEEFLDSEDDSSYKNEGDYANGGTPNSHYPWVKDHDHSKQKEIADWLTLEMKDFVNYISPSSEEIVTRNNVISTLKTEIGMFWPGTETHVFGSCATDLYLPGSDIDMVVVSETGDYENRSRLYQLSTFLRTKKLAKNVEVIASAKVPIIKFVDPISELHIDVSFERTNGLDAAKRIRRWLISTPGLRELVLVIKQFLRSRRLNNVHVGGLGGYATIIMCYHFLRLHPKLSTSSMDALDNLGVLLIEFFELYGRNFSYDDLIISLDSDTEEPRYEKKANHPILNTSRNTFSIVIRDPADTTNNITRSSYNLRDLKKAFGGAYQLLVEKCYQLNAASYKQRLGQSILGDIIKYKGKERDFNDDRHKVVNHALINHEEETDDESDGLDGNDKYYFSDMTVESNEDEYVPPKKRATPVTNKAKDTKKLVESFLSLEDNSDADESLAKDNAGGIEEEPYIPKLKKVKSNLDKDIKRDYWRQKGLDL
ncbi:topoisomerase 1-related protein TRF4, putative [Candida dubliniensis CD36]|uniref:polynucleotide adenylyltransferase n=1 Tax=Candida dubliniensis (strain CD36 / ATCC MYA-646 / CBS 7987 / NCPF 3949 / NRRL Y-17841) TaxID=573826 RepID=B9W7V4_CANDC|nr:topoisomerase 1-related protein TRF4, putative [Candida dubliniensis CD36]CAX44767.1 topoisomerase 1-related protein TRF4, putative [Candida dubliniensis CD36]